MSSRVQTFGPEELQFLQAFGQQIALAIENAQLYGATVEVNAHLQEEIEERNRAEKTLADFTAMTGGMFGSVTKEQKKWLARIEANSQNLVDLVSDFLDVSKLESGYVDINREMINLTGLIQKNVDSYRVLALDKSISIKGAVEPHLPAVYADPRRLDQVLSNLISNSLKFTGEGGTVEVGAAQTDATLIRLWVRDNGVGIAANEMGQLFEKYRQGGNVKHSSHKGTGLGLVICKMIVEAHGGRIWVESIEGKGATFFFSLPINA